MFSGAELTLSQNLGLKLVFFCIVSVWSALRLNLNFVWAENVDSTFLECEKTMYMIGWETLKKSNFSSCT